MSHLFQVCFLLLFTFRITKDMSKVFCPQCGNNTLMKISVQVDEKGNITHIQNTRRQLNLRGTKVFTLLSFLYLLLVPNSITKRREKQQRLDFNRRSIFRCNEKEKKYILKIFLNLMFTRTNEKERNRYFRPRV